MRKNVYKIEAYTEDGRLWTRRYAGSKKIAEGIGIQEARAGWKTIVILKVEEWEWRYIDRRWIEE